MVRSRDIGIRGKVPADVKCSKDLFHQISRGDEKSFRELFDLYRAELFDVVIRLTKSEVIAEEIIQEIFIGLWISRERLAEVENPVSYLYRILLNKTLEYLKKEANQEKIIRSAAHRYQQPANLTEQRVDANETKKIIEKAVGHLTPQQKIVYELSRRQGLSVCEIASELRVSRHTVKNHLSKAMLYIRTYLQNIAVIVWVLFRTLL